MADQIGMAKSDVAGVVGPETGTAHGHMMTMTFAPSVFEDVADNRHAGD